MSDIQNDQTVADAIGQGTPPAGEQDYRALWEQEKSERIKERNLYRPVQRILSDLDTESVSAISALAEMVRRGDTEGITEWSLATAQNVSGKDLAAIIAARQNGQAPAAAPGATSQAPEAPQQVIDPEMIRRMVEETAAEQVRVSSLAERISAEMAQAGYTPRDPAGQVIIQYARQNNVPINDAIEWFEADAAARVAQRNQRLAQVAAATPAPAPDGAPAGTAPAPDMSPKDKAMARLRAGSMG